MHVQQWSVCGGHVFRHMYSAFVLMFAFSASSVFRKNACVILTCSILNPFHSDDSLWVFHYLYLMRSLSDFPLFFLLLTDFPSVLKIIVSCLCLLSPLSSVKQSWLSWMRYYHWQRPAVTAPSWRCGQASWKHVAGQRLPCWAVCRRGPWRYHLLHPRRTFLHCCPPAFMCISGCSTTMPGWKIRVLLQPKCKERMCTCVCTSLGFGRGMKWFASLWLRQSIHPSIEVFIPPESDITNWFHLGCSNQHNINEWIVLYRLQHSTTLRDADANADVHQCILFPSPAPKYKCSSSAFHMCCIPGLFCCL